MGLCHRGRLRQGRMVSGRRSVEHRLIHQLRLRFKVLASMIGLLVAVVEEVLQLRLASELHVDHDFVHVDKVAEAVLENLGNFAHLCNLGKSNALRVTCMPMSPHCRYSP